MGAQSPRLLDRVREHIRLKHYSYRTEQQHVGWIRRFILFHGERHPSAMGAPEVEAFLSDLAVRGRVAAATQAQALAALLFLYKQVLGVELPWLDNIVRATQPKRLPVVLTPEEARAVIARLKGQYWLIGNLLYGSGLRLLEALRLRIKDLDFEYDQVTVRDGKGGKDRVTVLPQLLSAPLQVRIARVREQHEIALQAGHDGVELPFALERKYPNAHREWGWQYVFPAARATRDPRTGVWRRHHVYEDGVQRAVRAAVRGRGPQARVAAHLPPQFCHPSSGERLRHPHGAGASRAQGRLDHADLHPRHAQGRARRAQPGGRRTIAPRRRRERRHWNDAHTRSGTRNTGASGAHRRSEAAMMPATACCLRQTRTAPPSLAPSRQLHRPARRLVPDDRVSAAVTVVAGPLIAAQRALPDLIGRCIGLLRRDERRDVHARRKYPRPVRSISMLGHMDDPLPMLIGRWHQLRHPGGLARPYLRPGRSLPDAW